MDSDSGDGPPRALLIAATVVAVAAVVTILVVAVLRQEPAQQQPVPVAAVPAPQASTAECSALAAALPEKLGDASRAELADPAPPGAAAWRADSAGEPIILRCGLDRPAEFVAGAPLQVVDDVQWFRVGEAGAEDLSTEQQRSTWYAVDRGVYVALTLPQGSGPTAIQQLSAVIAKTLPAKPVDPAPVR
ncbi:hypothetical protein A5765_13520 [Mycolicibacterium celeriflavum]|uniref:Membrane protein n=1 Tax=Mycolicibacterium celeriflavum TaxID=1249101 RepID=A0A1X0C2K2_MYCCF|nr:DUF3515 domain-containing protein [Mycolicibacterium celeriflavum]MCV7239639.1 DUF3515 domain-containing protein [Mycolicibacterium celeriflavum]OBG13356.1 hypothetical protein A5765_13520 [Mycolicibacterium celeriflavum]ORA51547.1 hypothetical protein BST21_00175 [Mycolicibacterium celeriflavum]BBY43332.1 membrane protein [Mycolicibacterium celeriflavum]